MQGLRIRINGLVQGVGFRPYVWHLAQACQLQGTVCNDSQGVLIEAWGKTQHLHEFKQRLPTEAPPLARIDTLHCESLLEACPHMDFRITHSHEGDIHTSIVPDAAMCPACHTEILDPANRRYRYPFTNCTQCGPRLSIVTQIPYDRLHTSMQAFELCADCAHEYTDPANRRFHAQPNACPLCGPQLWLEDSQGQRLQPAFNEEDCLDTANRLLRKGYIVAIMGLGGVHLACDASNEQAVAELRRRKQRYQKPFALMARAPDIIRQYCVVSGQEAALLHSQQAPIVLLNANQDHSLAPSIAPAQTTLGFMLPYTPLHALLLSVWETPLVMTSANLSDEPQCITLEDTRQRLKGIADYLLLHDRPIVNRVDDSIVRMMAGKPRLLRRARGYAPAPLALPEGFAQAPALLAMGGELKSTIALVRDGQVTLSQHLGDLEDARTWQEYQRTLQLYQHILQHKPQGIVIDQHPSYRSSQWGQQLAKAQSLPLAEVQHHHAHIASCMADNGWPLNAGKVLGIVLDGLGYGDDGTLWGGEFLLADYCHYTRLGHFKPLPLPGGTQAIRQPWRNLWAHLQALDWEKVTHTFGELAVLEFLQQQPIATLKTMLAQGLNSPLSSSCGRLFDAVAAAVGTCRDAISYEGQAAIELEAATPACLLNVVPPYPFKLHKTASGCWEIDPAPMWCALLHDLQTGYNHSIISAHFHQGLIQILTDTVTAIAAEQTEVKAIVLSGGVFQNNLLLSGLVKRLQQQGWTVLTHQHVPTNDGGLSLGQAAIGTARWLTALA